MTRTNSTITWTYLDVKALLPSHPQEFIPTALLPGLKFLPGTIHQWMRGSKSGSNFDLILWKLFRGNCDFSFTELLFIWGQLLGHISLNDQFIATTKGRQWNPADTARTRVRSVPGVGLEPTRGKPSQDFKSCASASNPNAHLDV